MSTLQVDCKNTLSRVTTSQLCTDKLLYLRQKNVDLSIKKGMRQFVRVQKNNFLIQTTAIFPLQLIGKVFALIRNLLKDENLNSKPGHT